MQFLWLECFNVIFPNYLLSFSWNSVPRCTLCAEYLTVLHLLKKCEEVENIREKPIPEKLEIKKKHAHTPTYFEHNS